jgi:hypothetical protein
MFSCGSAVWLGAVVVLLCPVGGLISSVVLMFWSHGFCFGISVSNSNIRVPHPFIRCEANMARKANVAAVLSLIEELKKEASEEPLP